MPQISIIPLVQATLNAHYNLPGDDICWGVDSHTGVWRVFLVQVRDYADHDEKKVKAELTRVADLLETHLTALFPIDTPMENWRHVPRVHVPERSAHDRLHALTEELHCLDALRAATATSPFVLVP